VLHVALGGLHEIRDQVVAPLELHVDLRPGFLADVLETDQAVVERDEPEDEDDEDAQQDPARREPQE
jgi:hypothetical protein